MNTQKRLALAVLTAAVAAVAVSAQETPTESPVPDPPPAAAAPADAGDAITSNDLRPIIAALEIYFRAEDEALAEDEPAGSPLDLTVADAVDRALTEHPRVLVAQSDVAAAQARVGQARAQALPQVGAQAGVAYVDPDSEGIGGGGLGGRIAERVIGDMGGEQTVTSGKLSVNQVLFAGGQIRAAVRASRYLAESEEWRRQATLDDLEFEVKEACYGVLLARALERVAQESVVTFERHEADARRMREVGVISGFEVLRAQTELGTRRSDAEKARNGVRLAKANLRRLLAMPPDTPARLQGRPPLKADVAPKAELTAQAEAQRPELLALERGILAAEQDVKRNQGQYWPRVAASAQYSKSDGGSSFMSQDGFQATVGAEVELFAGGRRKAQVAEAREKLSSVRSQYEEVKDLVELDVTRAYIQLQDAAALVRSELGNVALAREGLRLAELRFQEGVGTQSETLDASLALTSAETALVRALHDYSVASAALEKAVGKAPESAEADPATAK